MFRIIAKYFFSTLFILWIVPAQGTQTRLAKATFAGGCFWCMVHPFHAMPGVASVVSGYTGGSTPDPTYDEVCSGTTGHVEAVEITYDPSIVSYRKLLDAFWMQINPTDAGGQFADRGEQYKSVIFYHDDEQKRLAERSKSELEKSGRFAAPIATEIRKASVFYPAEEYHQDYYKKNPTRYRMYRSGSGRELFLEKHWGRKEKSN